MERRKLIAVTQIIFTILTAVLIQNVCGYFGMNNLDIIYLAMVAVICLPVMSLISYTFYDDFAFFIIAFLLRIVIMLWNVYGRAILTLPGVGTDTEGFYEYGVLISKNLRLLFDNKTYIYGSYYSKYLGILFFVVGQSYLFASFLNMIYGVCSIFIFKKTLDFYEGSIKLKRRLLKTYAVIPNGIVITTSLRRESLIILCLAISLYFFCKWERRGKMTDILVAVAFVLIACIFHAGVIGLLVGYTFMGMFYQPRTKQFSFDGKNLLFLLIFIGVIFVIVFKYSNVFLAKLSVEDASEIYRQVSKSRGNAAYLTNIKINSFSDIMKYAPIKWLYFLMSPVPWKWRGISDVVAFFMDAIIYVIMIKNIFIAFKGINKTPLAFALSLSFMAGTILYAISCGNAANAMRHRLKFIEILLMISYLIQNKEVQSRRQTYK